MREATGSSSRPRFAISQHVLEQQPQLCAVSDIIIMSSSCSCSCRITLIICNRLLVHSRRTAHRIANRRTCAWRSTTRTSTYDSINWGGGGGGGSHNWLRRIDNRARGKFRLPRRRGARSAPRPHRRGSAARQSRVASPDPSHCARSAAHLTIRRFSRHTPVTAPHPGGGADRGVRVDTAHSSHATPRRVVKVYKSQN